MSVVVPSYEFHARRYARDMEHDIDDTLRFAAWVNDNQDDPKVAEHLKFKIRSEMVDMVLELLPDHSEHAQYFVPVLTALAKRIRARFSGMVPEHLLAEIFDPVIGERPIVAKRRRTKKA